MRLPAIAVGLVVLLWRGRCLVTVSWLGATALHTPSTTVVSGRRGLAGVTVMLWRNYWLLLLLRRRGPVASGGRGLQTFKNAPGIFTLTTRARWLWSFYVFRREPTAHTVTVAVALRSTWAARPASSVSAGGGGKGDLKRRCELKCREKGEKARKREKRGRWVCVCV
jgi:hypothetical protein